MNHFPVQLLKNLHAPCASQARACVLCAKLLQCCCPRTWPARDPGAMRKALPSTAAYCKACTNYFPVLLCTTKLAQTTSQYYCVLQSLHRLLPSTTLYYKACRKHFPVIGPWTYCLFGRQKDGPWTYCPSGQKDGPRTYCPSGLTN